MVLLRLECGRKGKKWKMRFFT